MTKRIEWGYRRTECACEICVNNCRHMPGYLIPSDLDRLTEGVADVRKWAETNLLASPGALVKDGRTGYVFRIPTLVPAVKPDGSCIHLTDENQCAIHENAPFGCAFFDCGPDPRWELGHLGLTSIQNFQQAGTYGLVWRHLKALGKVQQKAEDLRKKMRKEL